MWKVLNEFKKFALCGNVVDLAVFCISIIHRQATRCPECTAELETAVTPA